MAAEETPGERHNDPALADGISRTDLESFLDTLFAEGMGAGHVPGVAFALVQQGKVVMQKGYGLADRERERSTNPDLSVFRAGSISKLVTATALMQLAERGELDLQDDVNEHLRRFQVVNPYPRTVTVAQLLTHTSGLDDTFLGQHVRRRSEVEPLGTYLARRLPPVDRPPGEFIRYSDHGASLAGHVVEAVSGAPFDHFAEENIFRPLGMGRTTFRQPPPDEWLPDLARGYRYARDAYRPYPLDYVHTTPAAGLFTTAADMSRFMLAHLGGGAYGGGRILQENTVAEMHHRQFTHHPKLRGRAYGFSEWLENGQRALFHDGSMPGFNSRLLLLPDRRTGFFLTWNSTSMGLKHALTTQFLDRYFPDETQQSEPPTGEHRPPRRFAGSYRDTLYSGRTMEKVVALTEQVRVREGEENTLRVGTSRFAEEEPGYFRSLEGEGALAFREEGNHVTHLFVGTGAFERLPWWGTRKATLSLFGLASLIFLWGVLAPLLALPGWLPLVLPPPLSLVSALVAGLYLAFLLGLGRGLPRVDIWEFAYGIPPGVKALLLLPMVAAGLSVLLLVLGVLLWGAGEWNLLGRGHFLLIAVSGLALLTLLQWWNLLGFRSG